MTKVLNGKSALVTGGGGGFGKASARLLLRDGAAVTLMGRSAETLDKARDILLREIPEARIAVHPGDASSEVDIKRAIEVSVTHGHGIDIVVSTVGGGGGYGKIETATLDVLMNDYLVNVGSAILVIREAVPLMKPGSSFVFISSTAAKLSFVNLASYCASKGALEQVSRVAANEYGAQGIRFNCVRPGLTHTDGMDSLFKTPGYVDSFLPFVPLGRTGIPNDIAEAVRFLAGPESSWLTGQSFAVDGGNELRMAPMPL